MNDTREAPPGPDTGPPDDRPLDGSGLRTLADATRSRDDRLVAGVCTGVARHLRVDPVIVRVLAVVLTFVGLAGLILYVAAWLLLPVDDGTPSPVARWFRVDESEPRVRTTGLVLAAVVAALAVIGDGGWGTGWLVWLLLLVVLPVWAVYHLTVVRPRRERGAAAPAATTASAVPAASAASSPAATTVLPSGGGTQAPPPHQAPQRAPRQRRPFSWALTGMTLCVAVIATALTYLALDRDGSLPWTVYVAIVLGVLAAGLLVGTIVGNAGPLILLGLPVAALLVVGTLVPTLSAGDVTADPTSARGVQSSYTHGAGILTIDLTDVEDPEALLGRTVTVESGVGETVVLVPEGLRVDVRARVRAGDVDVLGQETVGTGLDVREPAPGVGRALTLDLEHSLGSIRVMQR